MKELLGSIRAIIYIISTYVGIFIYFASKQSFGHIQATQLFGIVSLVYLYITLLPSPLYSLFPALPYKPLAIKSRQAFGVSSFFFACVHAYYGFFGFVGGFANLRYWSTYYTLSLFYGIIALAILSVLALTSLPYFVHSLGRYWKLLHRLVYIAALLILLHGVTVTIHLLQLKAMLIIAYPALLLLIALEIIRFNRYIRKKYRDIPHHVVTGIGVPIAAILLYWSFFFLNHHTH